jgi:hypothetical protein
LEDVMQRAFLGAVIFGAIAGPALAEDCSQHVVAAMEKQHTSKAFRVETTQPTAEGMIKMTVDYLPPDKMMQTVTGANLPGPQQTILVGERAFSGSNGAFEELLPQFTQSIIAEFQRSLGTPDKVGNFECQGKVTFEGKEYLGYRAMDTSGRATKPENALARTIYVDLATGLPAYNVIGLASGEGEPAMKVIYSYPTDIVIEAPVGAPVQRGPH